MCVAVVVGDVAVGANALVDPVLDKSMIAVFNTRAHALVAAVMVVVGVVVVAK